MEKENSRASARNHKKQSKKLSEGARKADGIKGDGDPTSPLQSEDIFEPDFHTMKKLRMPIRRKISKGSWTIEENKSYYEFLVNNKESFTTEALRRQGRVFCRLSEVLHKKRTPDQCRSHHQKMMGSQQEPIDIAIARLQLKIRQSEQEKLSKRKTRMFGKFKLKKQAKIQKLKEQQDRQFDFFNKQQNSCEIYRIIKRQFYNVITYKQSNLIHLEIQEAAIKSYIL